MGVYKLTAQELADKIIDALEAVEGDFEISELKRAFNLVVADEKRRRTSTAPDASPRARRQKNSPKAKRR